ncbi:MAG: hypothetical protein O7G84_00835 [Gammaproteobacteria bacterium]|nr:hypothetical protein [Gammaproteobacteria bacterium]
MDPSETNEAFADRMRHRRDPSLIRTYRTDPMRVKRGESSRAVTWFRANSLTCASDGSFMVDPYRAPGAEVVRSEWFEADEIAHHREAAQIHVAIYDEHVPPGWGVMAIPDPT